MDVVWTVAGAVLVALTLRDIFDTLFHPLGRGYVGRWVVGAVSRLAHRARATPVLIGPLGYIAVVATWAALLTVGWALIFFPHLPGGFLFGPGLDPEQHGDLADALYVSLVNLTSLGYGDISPEEPLLRILGPVETLFGLGLLTASISWLISIYSAISRRDSFAHEVHLSKEAEQRLGEKLADADAELLERMLASYTVQLVATRRDLIHFPITHHFRTEDEDRALSGLLPFLRRLVEEASEDRRPHALKVRAEMLGMAIDDFAETLRTRLRMPGETTEETLEHYDAHHRGPASHGRINSP
jgi:voltage-gated potassium channel Kch